MFDPANCSGTGLLKIIYFLNYCYIIFIICDILQYLLFHRFILFNTEKSTHGIFYHTI